MCALICVRKLARTVPTNYILLFLFTFCEAYFVMFAACIFEPKVVGIAALFTSAVCIGLTIYALTSKTDFTYGGGSVAIFLSTMIALLFA